MMSTDAKRAGNKRYLETLDDIRIRVKKGEKAAIKDAATAAGYDSLNAYINDAISEKMAKKP